MKPLTNQVLPSVYQEKNKGIANSVFLQRQYSLSACPYDKRSVFWRAGFYPTNHSSSNTFQKALIGWKKAGPTIKPALSFCFGHR